MGPTLGDFYSCFHAVIVFGLGKSLLFKSVLAHYGIVLMHVYSLRCLHHLLCIILVYPGTWNFDFCSNPCTRVHEVKKKICNFFEKNYQLLINLIARHNKSAFNLKGLSRKPQLNTALDYLRDYYFDNISLTELAAIAHMSPFHFIRQFKAETGMTPHVYQTQFRINRAKQMLRSGLAINEVALSVGFYDQSHFHRYFKKNMGLTPKQYSKAVLYQAS